MDVLDRYAVFGNPIAHSKSPQIHQAFATQAGENISYTKQCVDEGCFAIEAKAFFDGGGLGLNVTVPFKQDACTFADELSDRAKAAGAVNTLVKRPDGRILGDNTDGLGLVSDIKNRLGWQLRDANVLILGAGGAVRGVLQPILAEGPSSVVIANRTASKARILADMFTSSGQIHGVGFGEINNSAVDVIINGTSASLSAEVPAVPPECISENTKVYDMVYGSEPTAFMVWAKKQGAVNISDGLGMLVGQAVESFRLWRGFKADSEPVIAMLRK
ncbi:MAG: shikimate dehydrogenase [Agarilytica sp.]